MRPGTGAQARLRICHVDEVGPLRVVITDFNFPSLDPEREVLGPLGASIEENQCRTEEQVRAAVRGAGVVLTQFAPITRGVIEALTPGATVVRYGVGVDNVDLCAAREHGVAVANVPDYCSEEVADHTVALLLSLLRKLPAFDAGVRRGVWDPVALGRPLPPLNRVVVGMVGMGRIGQAVVERLRPFGCQVRVHDPYLPPERALRLGVERVALEVLLEEADALTLHLPLTPETHHFLNAERISRLKSTAVVVNAARGGLVDTEALAAALRSGRLAGAGLDVFEEEPLPASHPLREVEGVLLSPHAAWYSEEALGRLQRLAAEEAARALKGEPLRCPVV